MHTKHTITACLYALAFFGLSRTDTAWAAEGATKEEGSSITRLFRRNKEESKPTYDVAPVVKDKLQPVYPYELLVSGESGWAESSFMVDHSGRPAFASPEASAPAFAKSLAAMIEASRFTPAQKNKHVVMATITDNYRFNGEYSLDEGARRVLAELRNGGVGISTLAELDERPRAIQQVAPVYPQALRSDGLTGQAEIEFVVDSEGRVLFPRIVSATHEDFGWAAATAVSQWRFQPPQKQGHKVEVRMTVPLIFDAGKLAATD